MDELFLLGLKILAAVHTGYLDISCTDCDESRQHSLNCSGEIIEDIVYENEEGLFTVCPIRMIPAQVYDFYDSYLYHQTFQGTAPSYNDCNKRYWDAVQRYRMYVNKYEEIMNKRPEDKDNTSENLAKLRSSFQRNKK